jgi:hypothetical protein
MCLSLRYKGFLRCQYANGVLLSAGPGPRKTDEQLVPQQAAKNLLALCCPRVRCGILVLVLSYPTASRILFSFFLFLRERRR